jgi:transposase-like protein
MRGKRFAAEQIIHKLREAEVELARGQTTAQVCRKLEISEQTYYRWRRVYGGLKVEQARRLKSLEKDNSRLKKVVAEQALDIAILKEAASGNW